MRTKNSAYTTPKGGRGGNKSNGNKKSYSPVRRYPPISQQLVGHPETEDDDDEEEVEEEEEEEVEEVEEEDDMLTYEDNNEDPDFDPVVDEQPKKRRGRPSTKNSAPSIAAAVANLTDHGKRGRKPSMKAAEAAAAEAAKTKSPATKSSSPAKSKPAPPPPSKSKPPPPATPPPKKRAKVEPVLKVANNIFEPVVTQTTPVPPPVNNSSAQRSYNYLKPVQQLDSVSEIKLKEVEDKFAREIEKLTRHHNMVVANLREEFAAKYYSMKNEWETEKKNIQQLMESLKNIGKKAKAALPPPSPPPEPSTNAAVNDPAPDTGKTTSDTVTVAAPIDPSPDTATTTSAMVTVGGS